MRSANEVPRFSNEVEVRAVIEGQIIAKRVHAENLGYTSGTQKRVFATGGASANKEILQVLADVFNAPVYLQDISCSTCLGSAYRAKHGFLGGATISFHDVVKDVPDFVLSVKPSADAAQVYNPMVARYRKLEESVLQSAL